MPLDSSSLGKSTIILLNIFMHAQFVNPVDEILIIDYVSIKF